jgi:hypothetical protein
MKQRKNDTDKVQTEKLEKILSHCNSVHYKSHMECLKFNLGRHGEKPHYNIVLRFCKVISNITLRFESYLGEARVFIIHLYVVKTA